MQSRARVLLAVLGFAVAMSTFILFGRPAKASPPTGRCQVTVPAEWGEFIGSSQYGLAFRDDQGTLRFVTQMPCGLDGPPHIALQVSRK